MNSPSISLAATRFVIAVSAVACLLAAGCAEAPSDPDVCGNGVLDSGEQCDDGNTASGDGCSATCTHESAGSCGDGVVDSGEQCDDAGESATCDEDCTLQVCGDGVANAAAGEQCDESGATASCNADCTLPTCTVVDPASVEFVVSDATQDKCFNDHGDEMTCPPQGGPFNGQDAQYATLAPAYSACNGVVTDLNTGLMWEQEHHDNRLSYADAEAHCASLTLGGYTDWRMPSIKELFSINDARGDQNTPGAYYLDSAWFDLAYPTDVELTGTHTAKMMGQTWSSTRRPDNSRINYFYNFLDGHMKSNFNDSPVSKLFYRCVRGDSTRFTSRSYTDHGDGTVTDENTGLMWQQANGEQPPGDYQFNWKEALSYCEDLSLGGHTDWRLPDVKELQSLVYYDNPDYASTKRVLDTSVFAFNLPAGKDLNTPPTTSPPNGSAVAPFFWSSTTHGDAKSHASYVCFGPCWAVEVFPGTGTQDAHGPGAQRSDPKTAPPIWPQSIGDQKDVVQVDNFVRCVRGGI